MLLSFNQTSPDRWFATYRILQVKHQKLNLKWIKIKLNRTSKSSSLHITRWARLGLIETGAERRKTARWKSSSCTGIHAYNSDTKCRKPTSSTLVQKWLRWEGQESQGPAPTVQSDITRRGGPLRLMLGYFTPHYPHPCQVKQTTECHMQSPI